MARKTGWRSWPGRPQAEAAARHADGLPGVAPPGQRVRPGARLLPGERFRRGARPLPGELLLLLQRLILRRSGLLPGGGALLLPLCDGVRRLRLLRREGGLVLWPRRGRRRNRGTWRHGD